MNKTGVLLEYTPLIQPIVTIDSQPSGTEVFVENRQLLDKGGQPATTPISIVPSVGEYQIELRKWGYYKSSFSLKVNAPGQQSPLPQRLKPASIRGKLVYENSGKLIAGVKVKLSPLGYEATTDSKGEFEFNDWETHRIQEGKEYRIQFPHPKKEKEVVLKMVELKYGGEERWQMSQLI